MSEKPQRIPLEMGTPTPQPVVASSSDQEQHDSIDPGITLEEGQREEIKEKVIAAIRTCYDPELPVNIYELGLIYQVEVAENGGVSVDMTLTSPACPVAGSLPGEVKSKIKAVPGVTNAKVQLVWDPPWSQDRMSEAARLELGLFG